MLRSIKGSDIEILMVTEIYSRTRGVCLNLVCSSISFPFSDQR